MKQTGQEFLRQPKRALTLIGMSGVGKTWLSHRLSAWGWGYYFCDHKIGTDFLGGELAAPVTPENLSALSNFVGKVGNPAQGGLALTEFKRRQKLYYDAECRALAEATLAADRSASNFVIDSTGSLCEIADDALLEKLGAKTVFVYIKTGPEDRKDVLERARKYPKPLFFPPGDFDGWLAEYMAGEGIKTVEAINPDDFARWIFPRLFESRLPKYQRLADLYGVTIPARTFREIGSEEEFLERIAEALGA